MTARENFPYELTDAEEAFSNEELLHVTRLQQAIAIAIHLARELPTTLSTEPRALCVIKLQDAAAWSAELLNAKAFSNVTNKLG